MDLSHCCLICLVESWVFRKWLLQSSVTHLQPSGKALTHMPAWIGLVYRSKILVKIQSIDIWTSHTRMKKHVHHICCPFAILKKWEEWRSLDKTLFFFYLLPFLLLQTDKLWRREHRVIQTSQSYCQSTNKSLWQQQTTKAQQKKKQEEQRLATINILEKTSEVKKGVHSAFLIVNSISTSSWTR